MLLVRGCGFGGVLVTKMVAGVKMKVEPQEEKGIVPLCVVEPPPSTTEGLLCWMVSCG